MLLFLTKVATAIAITSLSSITRAHVTNSSCPSYPGLLAEPVAPIPMSDLPTTFRAASNAQPADTIAQILNTLSLYPLAIDSKNFDALSLVFTADVYANFSAPLNVLTSLAAVEAAINQTLAFVDTQHSYGTQIVEVQTDCRARSVSYFTATHFGRGRYFGQVRKLLLFKSSLAYMFSDICFKTRPFKFPKSPS